jgi:hypothetical protein
LVRYTANSPDRRHGLPAGRLHEPFLQREEATRRPAPTRRRSTPPRKVSTPITLLAGGPVGVGAVPVAGRPGVVAEPVVDEPADDDADADEAVIWTVTDVDDGANDESPP